jgi:hypothetical protein
MISAKSGGVSPQNETWIAVVSCQRSENVFPLEIGNLDEPVFDREWICTLDLCRKNGFINVFLKK